MKSIRHFLHLFRSSSQPPPAKIMDLPPLKMDQIRLALDLTSTWELEQIRQSPIQYQWYLCGDAGYSWMYYCASLRVPAKNNPSVFARVELRSNIERNRMTAFVRVISNEACYDWVSNVSVSEVACRSSYAMTPMRNRGIPMVHFSGIISTLSVSQA